GGLVGGEPARDEQRVEILVERGHVVGDLSWKLRDGRLGRGLRERGRGREREQQGNSNVHGPEPKHHACLDSSGSDHDCDEGTVGAPYRTTSRNVTTPSRYDPKPRVRARVAGWSGSRTRLAQTWHRSASCLRPMPSGETSAISSS